MFTFASCDDPKPTCPPHVDENSDGACDVCDKEIEPDLDPDDIPDLSGITLEDESLVYDGEEHTLLVSGTLPEGVTVTYVGGNKSDVGEYEVTAKFFYNGKELTDSALTATLTIKKATINLFGVSAENLTVIYNGTEQAPTLTGTLPDGVGVEYSYENAAGEAVERIVNVGEYKVTATFVYDTHNYNELAPKKFNCTVTPATYDMSGVRVLSVTKTYDGKEVAPTLVGTLPEGVSHTFTVKNSLGETVEKIVDAGVYTVYATFTSDDPNYFPIDPISATVTVESLEVGEVSFDDLTVTYDGKAHTILVVGTLPEGVSVVYEGGDKTAVGTYEIVAKFYVGEIELVEERLTATLTIKKATIDMSGVSAPDGSAAYNGAEHKPTISGEIPAGVEVVYTYTDAMGNTVDKIIAAGAYKITASFVYDTDCYDEINPITFNYTVTKAGFDVSGSYPESVTRTYDGAAVKPTLAGSLPAGVEVVYTYTDASGNAVSEIVKVGEYTVVASFIYDETNYDKLEPVTFVYTVTKGTYDLSGVKLESVTKTYDGKAVEISLGTLPAGLTATVTLKNSLGETVSEMLNAGTYSVSAVFEGDLENYYPVNEMTATVEIKKAAIGGISFTDAVFAFDGAEKSIFVVGAPEWLEITYEGNGVTAPGTYTVTATFGENANYVQVPPMQAKIVIEIDKSTPTDGIVFEAYKDGYAVSGVKAGVSIVVIPATHEGKPVLSVKSFAFDGNEELTYVYVPSSVINIGNRAFADCKSLTTVEFGDIEVIGQQAFKNTAIKEISLPESLESIGFGAFEGTKLERITLPFVGGSRNSSSEYIGFIFGASSYAANTVKVPATLTSVTLSNGCKSVPARAFYGLTSLTNVVFGRSVGEIGIGAFEGCTSLRSVYIPASVVTVQANGKVENAPFFGGCEELMIVVESVSSTSGWGQYFAAIGEGKTALVIYNKTYDDYVMNKESYREFDPSDATLSTIFVGGALFDKFDPSVYEYTLDADIKLALPEIGAMAAAPGATITIVPASASNGNVSTVTVVSTNGEKTLVYKIKFNVTGSFNTSAEIVNKNGAEGTVSYIVDDGYKPTATWVKEQLEKYASLSITFAVSTKNFATLETTTNAEGLEEYVFDENGNYKYTVNQENVDFWRDILSVGRAEIASHSHTHGFWGYNDEGGSQAYLNSAGTSIGSKNVPVGSTSKEVFASLQIVRDLFGDTSSGLSFVTPGISAKVSDFTLKSDLKLNLEGAVVRVTVDTPVTAGTDGAIRTDGPVEIDLQSVKVTLPADAAITTTLEGYGSVIPAGTVITVAEKITVTVPAGTLVKGANDNLYAAYTAAMEAGVMIGARLTSGRVYVASQFTDITTRQQIRAMMITSKTNDTSVTESWIDYIDSALDKGALATFCIHAITDSYDTEGQGGHVITKEQAEILFKYTESLGDRVWVATLTDAMTYFFEWSTAKVTASYADGAISVSLTDGEDDKLFNMPLTVKVTVPGNWSGATVNGEALTIRTAGDGTQYVYVDVAPETTVSIVGE